MIAIVKVLQTKYWLK